MEKLDLIKKYIRNYKPLSEIPGISLLKKIEDIELGEPLILRHNGNGKPIARIKIIIPEKIKKSGDYYFIEGSLHLPEYNIENANLVFTEKSAKEAINSNQLKEDSIVRKWYKLY